VSATSAGSVDPYERRVKLAVQWRVVTAAEGRRWLGSVEAAASRGDFYMSLNYDEVVGVRV
jgi:hypothetical protein